MIPECVSFLIETKRIHQTAAKAYLEAHQLIHSIRHSQENLSKTLTDAHAPTPSIFYVEHGEASLHIAFESISNTAFIQMNQEISKDLFGDKSHEWIISTLNLLDKVRLTTLKPLRSNVLVTKKLKMISILINVLIKNLIIKYSLNTRIVVIDILNGQHINDSKIEDYILKIGFPLLKSLWQVFEWRVKEWVENEDLKKAIIQHQKQIMHDLIHGTDVTLDSLLQLHSQRFQVRLFLLFDAISFDPDLLNFNELECLQRMGHFLEWKQMLAHDISRLDRDYDFYLKRGLSTDGSIEKGVVNSFLYWMHFNETLSMDNMTNHRLTFIQSFIELFDLFDPKEFQVKNSIFDSNQIQSIISNYLEYYKVVQYFNKFKNSL